MKITAVFLPCLMVLGTSVLAMPSAPQVQSPDPGAQQTTQVVRTTTRTTTVNVVSRSVLGSQLSVSRRCWKTMSLKSAGTTTSTSLRT